MIEVLYLYSMKTNHISGALKYYYARIEILKTTRYCVHITNEDFQILRLRGIDEISYKEHRKRLRTERTL